MDHNAIRHKLSEYLDGSVTEKERSAIDSHLKRCASCSEALSELRKTIEHVKKVEEIEPPAWMTGKIMAKVREEADQPTLRQKISRIFSYRTPIPAATLLFLIVASFYLYRESGTVDRLTEAPRQGAESLKEVPANAPLDKKDDAERPAARAKKVPQTPEYKSLDMKYEYEKPAPPQPMSEAAPAAAGIPQKAAEESATVRLNSISGNAAAPQIQSSDMMEKKKSHAAAPPAAPQKPAAPVAVETGAIKDKGREKISILQEGSDAADVVRLNAHFSKNELARDTSANKTFLTQKIKIELPDLEWMDSKELKLLRACGRKYVIEFVRDNVKQRYYYCLDADIIKLLMKYELKQNTWEVIR